MMKTNSKRKETVTALRLGAAAISILTLEQMAIALKAINESDSFENCLKRTDRNKILVDLSTKVENFDIIV